MGHQQISPQIANGRNLINFMMNSEADTHCLSSHQRQPKPADSSQFREFTQIRNSFEAQLANRPISTARLINLAEKIFLYLGKTPQMQLQAEPGSRIIQLLFSKIKSVQDFDAIRSLSKILIHHYLTVPKSGRQWKKCLQRFADLMMSSNIQLVSLGIQAVHYIYRRLRASPFCQPLVFREADRLLQASLNPNVVLSSVKILSVCMNKYLTREAAQPCLTALVKFLRAKQSCRHTAAYYYALVQISKFLNHPRYSEVQMVIDSGVLGPISQMVLSQIFCIIDKYVFKIILALSKNALPSQNKAIRRSAFIDELMLFGLHLQCKRIRSHVFQTIANMSKHSSHIEALFSEELILMILFVHRSGIDKELSFLIKSIVKRISPASLKEYRCVYDPKIVKQCCESFMTCGDLVVLNQIMRLILQTCQDSRSCLTNEPLMALKQIAARTRIKQRLKFIIDAEIDSLKQPARQLNALIG